MRLLDLSRLLPGPYCAGIFADWGAEVIKVEQPGRGDLARLVPPFDPQSETSLLFRALNRGKKSITLNLKAPAGREILLRLTESADVLLESFRPGVMERLELGYDVLAEANPRLVYCSLSGYGRHGPYRDRPGHDLNYVGLAGLLELTGPADGPPAIPGAPVADLAGSLWAAVGILFALLERERTGQGQRVDGSLLGGALSCLSLATVRAQAGQPMGRGASDLTGGLVCYNAYRTQDGRYMTLAALEPEFWAAFCRAAGCEELLNAQFNPAVPGEPTYEALCALFAGRTRAEWEQLLASADACCDPVYSVQEALAAGPLQVLNMISDAGLLPPVTLSGRSWSQPGPSPALGEHTPALLAELGYTPAGVERLRAEGVV